MLQQQADQLLVNIGTAFWKNELFQSVTVVQVPSNQWVYPVDFTDMWGKTIPCDLDTFCRQFVSPELLADTEYAPIRLAGIGKWFANAADKLIVDTLGRADANTFGSESDNMSNSTLNSIDQHAAKINLRDFGRLHMLVGHFQWSARDRDHIWHLTPFLPMRHGVRECYAYTADAIGFAAQVVTYALHTDMQIMCGIDMGACVINPSHVMRIRCTETPEQLLERAYRPDFCDSSYHYGGDPNAQWY